MIEIKRKKGETFESMYRRFNKRIQSSRKILHAKQIQYNEKKGSRNIQKKNKIEKLKRRDQREYLRKSGKLKEDDMIYGRRKGY